MKRNKSEKKDNKESLYVRIDSPIKKSISNISKEAHISLSQILEILIEDFIKLDDDRKKDTLNRNVRDPLRVFAKMLEMKTWAEHAFMLKRWTWALEEYMSLDKFITKNHLACDELRKICLYKQAYCWLDIGIQIRKEALSLKDNTQLQKYYDAAIDCINRSIGQNSEFITGDKKQKELLFGHPIILFNIACANSLLSQYKVEKKLIYNYLKKSNEANDEKIWSYLGENWRQEINNTETENDIMQNADLSMSLLDKILTITNSQSYSPSSLNFLVDLSKTDPDLLFLRYDKEVKNRYSRWYQEKHKKESLLDSYEKLCNVVESSESQK